LVSPVGVSPRRLRRVPDESLDEPREFPVGSLWVDPEAGEVRLPGGEEARRHSDYETFMVYEQAILELPLPHVSEAFSELADALEAEGEWFLATQERPHSYDNPRVRTGLTVLPRGDRRIDVEIEIDELMPYADEAFEAAVPEILAPLLRRWDAALARDGRLTEGSWNGYQAVQLSLPTAGRTGSELIRFVEEARALLRAAREGPLDLQAARDLIVAGRAGALVGLREGTWLDVKSAPYRLDVDANKFELARDVSAFANAQGGLLLLPATTRNERNGEVVDEIRDLDLNLVDVNQVRDVLSTWVHPTIVGLEVRAVETTHGRGQLLIHVPPQPSDSWPYLVTRAPIGDRVRSTALAICVRHDAEIRALDPASIHALLRTGRHAARAAASDPAGSAPRTLLAPPLDALADEAEGAGHHVQVDARELRITPPGGEPVVCVHRDLQPITLMLEVTRLCEALEPHGLPVHRTTRGYLLPGSD
jgi:hypothetical protein